MFHLNCSFVSWNEQILGGNQEVKNEIILSSWNGLRKLSTLIFGKTLKPLWIKGSKMVRWWTTREKNSEHIWQS